MALAVELERTAGAGGPFYVSIGLENGRKDDVAFVHQGHYRVFDIRLVDSEGKDVPFTRFGQRNLARDGPSLRGRIRMLKPGLRRGSYLNLARLFDLSEAGTYHLTIGKTVFRRIKDLGDPIKLEIRDIPVTVRNPTEQDRDKWR